MTLGGNACEPIRIMPPMTAAALRLIPVVGSIFLGATVLA